MRNIGSWLPLIAAAVLCAVALSWRAEATGAAGAAAPQTSVAVVNLDAVFKGLKELDDRTRLLAETTSALRTELEARNEELRLMIEERGTLPEGSQALRDLDLKGLRMEATLAAETQFHERWLEGEKIGLLKEMFIKVDAAVASVAARDGWDVVLWDHRSNPALDLNASAPNTIDRLEAMNGRVVRRTVAYSSPRADITQLVIDTMNNAYAAGQ